MYIIYLFCSTVGHSLSLKFFFVTYFKMYSPYAHVLKCTFAINTINTNKLWFCLLFAYYG